MYYLSSGSNPKYNAYMGAYRLQWDMIQFAKQQGIDRYNFTVLQVILRSMQKITVYNVLKKVSGHM